MTKILLVILSLTLLLTLTFAQAESKNIASDGAPEIQTAEEGVWVPADDPAVTEETYRLIQEALNGLVGVDYRPVACLGSRLQDGITTHAILCQARIVVPNAQPRFVVFYINEDSEGIVTTLKIAEYDIGALCP